MTYHSLLGIEEDLAEQLWHRRHDLCITQENVVRLHQRTTSLERLVLSTQLFHTHDTVDKLDVVCGEQVLVFSLRASGEETDR